MRKILYIIPILLLTLILSSNVYGYTTTAEGNIKFDSISEMYDYLESNNYTFDRTIDYDTYNTKRDELINSDLFKDYIEDYPYYAFSGSTSVYLFDKIPNFHTEYVYNTDGYYQIKLVAEHAETLTMVQVYHTASGNITSVVREDLPYRSISEIKFSSSTKFYSRSDLGFYLKPVNFDLCYTNSNENIIVKNPEFSFVPSYSENYESCNLKLDIINEPENYTLQYAINSSSSEWREFDNSVGVTVENNCLVIVRMLDENGDELFASSYNVAILEDMLSSTYFRVNFDNSQKCILGFTPILYNNASDSFDIYFSYNSVATDEVNSGKVAFQNTNNAFTIWDNYSNSVEDFICGNGSTYYLRPNGGAEITLTFKIVNKYSGVTALTRTFKFNLSYDYAQALESTTNGTKDGIFNSGAGSSLENNLLTSDKLEIDWSTENATETAKSFFNNAVEFLNVIVTFLSVLPAWITVPLYTFFFLLLILFVIKFIRG